MTKEPGFINDAFLLWIGSEFYGTIEDYTSEAIVMGISKRIPSVHIGRQMMEPGAVVFVAHDEGKTKDCKKCMGFFECPLCRKRTEEIASLRGEIDRVKDRYKDLLVAGGIAFTVDFSKSEVVPAAARSFVALRERKIAVLFKEHETCAKCSGAGNCHGGTGGTVVLPTGQKWDYRKYNYFLHQPKKFNPETDLKSKKMCATCGGTGELPVAQIFGVFVPEQLEYILTGEESADFALRTSDVTKIGPDALKVEYKRKCGKRKPGGFYVTTRADALGADAITPEAAKLEKDLKERGLVTEKGCDVTGSFIRFTKPLAVNEKRFRGVKRIDMASISRAVKIEAEGIREALA